MNKKSIRPRVYFIISILIFIVVLFIFYGNHRDTLEIIESKYDSKIELVEQSIYNETKYTHELDTAKQNPDNYIVPEEEHKKYVEKNDIVARFGGDEFSELVSGIKSSSEIKKIGQEIGEAFEENLILDSIEIEINPSIGISIYPDHGEDPETLLTKSDDAMYKAKEGNLGYKNYKPNDSIF